MNKVWLCLFICLFANCAIANNVTEIVTDSVAPDYNQAVDLCLFHRFAEAEVLLKQILRQPAHPNHDAAGFLLMEEVYLWRGLYQQYVWFADSTGQHPPNYSFAKHMVEQRALQLSLLTDGTTLPFKLKKKGHIVIEGLINGKARKFIVDTRAQRTMISTDLAKEIRLPRLIEATIINSLGQALPSAISVIDSMRIGGLQVSNLPVFVQSLWGFDVDGLLGWDVLSHFCFTIDFRTKTVVLQQPVIDSTTIKNLLGSSQPLLAFHGQPGNQLNFFFDSGSNGKTSFSPNGLTRISYYKPGRALSYQLGAGGKMKFSRERTVKRTNLNIDGQSFRVKNATIQRMNKGIGGVIIDGVVGSRQFLKGRLTVDYLNNHFAYHE